MALPKWAVGDLPRTKVLARSVTTDAASLSPTSLSHPIGVDASLHSEDDGSESKVCTCHRTCAMSLLRLLPSLRIPVARAYTTASATSSSLPEILDDLIDREASTTSTSAYNAEPIDDGPPVAPYESYPRDTSALEANPLRRAKQTSAANMDRPLYAVYVKASRNNTIVTFARPKDRLLAPLVTLTGGKLGFKKSNRNGYEAGYQCSVGIIAAMEKELARTEFEWELYLNGFGQGRDAMLTALTTAVGERVKPLLRRVTDRTPLKIGGTRGQKTRRV